MGTAAPLFQTALLVEDEVQLGVALKISLQKLGIQTFHVSTLELARKTFESDPPEFILLDRNLPDGDGLELCAYVRSRGYTGSILILTASGGMDDRVAGLDSGADDYLPKPFSWKELEARIRALSRRRGSSSLFPEASWSIREDRLEILGPKGWVQLTPLEFKLATRLIRSEGSIISRNDLLKDVWGFTLLPRTRTVDHFLGRLRKHFESDSEKPVHFLTIRGAGYKFQK